MNLSDEEKRAVVSVLTLYRAWMYTLVKDSESKLDSAGKSYLAATLANVSSAQKKIEAALGGGSVGQARDNPSRKNLSNARVLLVDDDEISLALMRSMLEDEGVPQVDVANDGEAALRLLESTESPYDVIVSDWRMPNITGLELHAQAQEAGLLNDSYFVLLTAIDDDVLASRAKKQGITRYLTKPLDVDAFDQMMAEIFQHQ